MRTADAHNDLLVGVVHRAERGEADPFGERWLPQLRAGAVGLQVLAVYVEEQYLPEGGLRRALRMIQAAYDLAEQHPEVRVCTEPGEVRSAWEEERIALVLSVEGLDVVGADLELLRLLGRLGVRAAGLTWNRRNLLTDSSGDETPGGLTAFGRRAVFELERAGIAIDVSHLSDAGFWDVDALHTRPYFASHSGCRAVLDHHRNLTDDQLRAIARSGGIVGINLFPGFLGGESVDDAIAHVVHAVEQVGADHVAIGADFLVDLFEQVDPILGGAPLADPSRLPRIAGLASAADLTVLEPPLVAAIGPVAARKVLGESLVRFFSAEQGASDDEDRAAR